MIAAFFFFKNVMIRYLQTPTGINGGINKGLQRCPQRHSERNLNKLIACEFKSMRLQSQRNFLL